LKTYLSLMISSEGSLASEITQKLRNLGFNTNLGSHDFVYDWKDRDVAPAEVINFVDRVQGQLKGMGVRFSTTTIK
jgi:hypothetical protein